MALFFHRPVFNRPQNKLYNDFLQINIEKKKTEKKQGQKKKDDRTSNGQQPNSQKANV